MNADRWMKMQRNVTLVSYVMMTSFWLVLFLPHMWWLGLLMVAHQSQGFWESMKADMADERAELIAARAGFLSQKLMMGAGILIFGFDRQRHLNGAWPLIAVLLVGVVSEGAFRKWLGAEKRQVKFGFLGLILFACLGTLVACFAWVTWRGY